MALALGEGHLCTSSIRVNDFLGTHRIYRGLSFPHVSSNHYMAEGIRGKDTAIGILHDFEPGDFPGVLLPERDDGIVTGP